MGSEAGRTSTGKLEGLLRGLHEAARNFDQLPFSPHRVGEATWKRYVRSDRSGPERGLRVLGWDEVVAELDADREATPYWVEVALRLREWRLSRVTWRVRMMAQLATRGWCEEDAWNLDHVLCSRLAAQLDSLADQLHGWPCTDEFATPEDWERALRHTASQLRRVHGSARTHAAGDAWLQSSSADSSEDAYQLYLRLDREDHEAVTSALRWVADHHQHLWD